MVIQSNRGIKENRRRRDKKIYVYASAASQHIQLILSPILYSSNRIAIENSKGAPVLCFYFKSQYETVDTVETFFPSIFIEGKQKRAQQEPKIDKGTASPSSRSLLHPDTQIR